MLFKRDFSTLFVRDDPPDYSGRINKWTARTQPHLASPKLLSFSNEKSVFSYTVESLTLTYAAKGLKGLTPFSEVYEWTSFLEPDIYALFIYGNKQNKYSRYAWTLYSGFWICSFTHLLFHSFALCSFAQNCSF